MLCAHKAAFPLGMDAEHHGNRPTVHVKPSRATLHMAARERALWNGWLRLRGFDVHTDVIGLRRAEVSPGGTRGVVARQHLRTSVCRPLLGNEAMDRPHPV